MDIKELELSKKAKNEYMRAYRKNNKDKIKAINNTYWLKKSQQQEGGQTA